MRLLRVDPTSDFSLTGDLTDNERLKYAILSHTWSQNNDEEVTFDDLVKKTGREKPGYRKILLCAEQAARDGIDYIWVDTCCINKSNNSVELQHAINSMFRWYQNAEKCYVYLEDVPGPATGTGGQSHPAAWELSLQKSRWFSRGWTLQELIAPRTVDFFSMGWDFLGSKSSLERQISEITRIPVPALRESRLDRFNFTERISWGETRQTKYEEDKVYSLLGICGVYMPLNYGEGRDYAFQRLYDEIERVHKGNKHEEFSTTFSLVDVSETDHFVARESELTQISDMLASDGSRRIAVLHGLGGIGKTQLALAYAKRYRHKYSAVFWLNINDIDSLKQSFARVATQILRDHPLASGLRDLAINGNLDEVVDAVKTWLSLPQNTRWLLIYDNYDNAKVPGNNDAAAIDIRKFFPESYQGSIIITTRLAQVKVGRQLPIKKLTNIEDSLQILAHKSGRQMTLDDPDAVRLVTALDGLPLALATAGAYLSQVPTTLSGYLRHYNASWSKLQKTAPELTEYEDKMLYSTWQISYDHIKRQNQSSAKLLKMWAYFDNEDVWLELLQHTDQESPKWIREITEDEMSFNNAMRVLCNHGLVEVNQSAFELEESRGYSMHRCVHAWTIHVLNQNWDVRLAALAWSLLALHVPTDDESRWWVKQRRLLQHASRCVNVINKHSIDDGYVHWIMHNLGGLYRDLGILYEAEGMYLRALIGFVKAYGFDHTLTLGTFNNLAGIYRLQNKPDEAEKMFSRALVGIEREYGPGHIKTLTTINGLGVFYADQGKLDEAEKMFLRVRLGEEKIYGPGHEETLGTLNNLGLVYYLQHKLDEAEEMFMQALVGEEKIYGPDHLSVLDTVNNLGLLYAHQRKLDEAEKMYSRALIGKEKAWGPDHAITLSAVYVLAEVLWGQCYEATWLAARQRLLFESAVFPGLTSYSQMIKLVNLCIQFPSSQPELLGHLCKIFAWIRWDDMSVTASLYAVMDSLPDYNSNCNGCERDLDITTGRLICRSCMDINLCSDCFENYELDGLKDVLNRCQDHRFLDLSKIGLEDNPDQTQLSTEQWLQELASDLKTREKNASGQKGTSNLGIRAIGVLSIA